MARAFPIGLDVGTTTVRMLQLSASRRGLRAAEAAKFVIPPETKQRAAARHEAIVSGVRRALRERRFRRREVVMALTSDELAMRHIRMPKTPAEELPTAVNWEVQNKFPFDTQTAVIQFLPVGEVHHGGQALEEVIVFAAPRREIDARLELADAMGLDLVSLDAEPCAIFRGFARHLRSQEDDQVVTALVDIGAETMVVVARGHAIVFVKAVPIGGTMFNRAVAEGLELSLMEAEALRRRLARRGGPEGAADPVCRAVTDAIRPHLEDLAGEIALCLRYYGVVLRAALPARVIFTGGESHHPAIPQMLAARLGVEPERGDPLRGIRTDHLAPVLDRHACVSEWATAVGLGLKGLRLAQPAAAA